MTADFSEGLLWQRLFIFIWQEYFDVVQIYILRLSVWQTTTLHIYWSQKLHGDHSLYIYIYIFRLTTISQFYNRKVLGCFFLTIKGFLSCRAQGTVRYPWPQYQQKVLMKPKTEAGLKLGEVWLFLVHFTQLHPGVTEAYIRCSLITAFS